MIQNKTRFFGRETQKAAIFNALSAETPQCVSILGDRRIGRSSLLWNLKQTYSDHLRDADRFRFAYVDVARDTCSTPNEFYAEAIQAMFGDRHKSLTPHEFDDLLYENDPSGRTRYVFLLDEFNVLQRRRDQFDDDFYDGLRSRANAGELTIVLATHVPLADIAVQNDFSSTFFSIFNPVTLGSFQRGEALASVTRSADPQLTQRDFGLIENWIDKTYHPLKLNIAADHLWQAQPQPNLERVKYNYDQEIIHRFGQTASVKRREHKQLMRRKQRIEAMRTGIMTFINAHPVFTFVLVIVPILILFGIQTPQQLWEALLNLITP